MNKIKTLFVMALLAVAGNVMADGFTAADVTIEPGKTATIELNLENSNDVYCFTVYLKLPEGISLYYDDDEESYGGYKKGYRTAKNGTFDFKAQGDNTWMINYFNTDFDKVITPGTGIVMNVFISASSDYQGGTGELIGCQTVDASTIPVNVNGGTFQINSSTTTGISSLSTEKNDAPIFTIGGQRVNKAGKGIFVQGGRKFIK